MADTDQQIGRALRAAAIARSKQAGETDPLLKRWVFSLVHQAMVNVYGPDYSIRCLETAAATKTLLDRCGLGGPIMAGALCAPQITANRNVLGWAGFWGRDHHFWATTNIHEMVDLSLGQLPLHPVTRARQPFPAPAYWWSMKKPPARNIHYLPYRLMGGVMSSTDQHLLDRLVKHVVELEETALAKSQTPNGIVFEPILSDIADLNALAVKGDPWASSAHRLQRVPLPVWVEARIAELNERKLYESALEQPDMPTFRRPSR